MNNISINGFGRIGRCFLRQAISNENMKILAINDLADLDNLIYLLKHDTVYGWFNFEIQKIEEQKQFKKCQSVGAININNQKIYIFNEKDPQNLPWDELAIDLVIESTGAFEKYTDANNHIIAGAKKVVITAPGKGNEGVDGRIVLSGINDSEFNNFNVVSNGSCTTNAVAPVIEILNKEIGVKKAILNTIHAYTNTQTIVDTSIKGDFLRGRAGAQNIIPASTGAANTVGKVIKELENKFDGIAIRVPIICGSLADLTFVSQKTTTKDEINNILTNASKSEKFKNIIAVSNEPLVSSDILKTTFPAIVDLTFTKVIDGDLIKLLIWYDNEWAYVATIIRQIAKPLIIQ